jgi:Restriction endonuclease
MKRKFELSNIEVILPSNKRVKVTKLIIELKEKMSTKEFEEEMEQLRTLKYSNNQEEDSERLIYDNDNSSVERLTIVEDDETLVMSEKSEIISDDETISEIVRTPREEDNYDRKAKELQNMDKYCKGEAMELAIKEFLEKEKFIVTKTQSTFRKQIIGDNGCDCLLQKKIGNQQVRAVIQSKCWNSELTGPVVRDLQGVLTNQFPDRIGIIVINGGGINRRARNIAENSKSTILIYNFNELKYLKQDLKRLVQQRKLKTNSFIQIERFDDAIVKKEVNGPIRTRMIKARKYMRFTAY